MHQKKIKSFFRSISILTESAAKLCRSPNGFVCGAAGTDGVGSGDDPKNFSTKIIKEKSFIEIQTVSNDEHSMSNKDFDVAGMLYCSVETTGAVLFSAVVAGLMGG